MEDFNQFVDWDGDWNGENIECYKGEMVGQKLVEPEIGTEGKPKLSFAGVDDATSQEKASQNTHCKLSQFILPLTQNPRQ
jgi:hypothetical protein